MRILWCIPLFSILFQVVTGIYPGMLWFMQPPDAQAQQTLPTKNNDLEAPQLILPQSDWTTSDKSFFIYELLKIMER